MVTRSTIHITPLILVLLLSSLSDAAIFQVGADGRDSGHPLFSKDAHEPPPRHVDIQHLQLDIALYPDQGSISGSATYTFEPLAAFDTTLVLFAANLVIDEILLLASDGDPAALAFETPGGDSLMILLDPDTLAPPPYQIRISYGTEPAAGLYFMSPTSADQNVRRQIWTDNVAGSSRHWFPAVEHPAEFFTTEVIARVPAGMSLLSNGRRLTEETNDDGSVTFHYLNDIPHTTASISLAGGEYEIARGQARLVDGRRLPTAYWVYPERIGDIRRTFGQTPEIIEYLDSALRGTYPWPGYSQVVAQNLTSGEVSGAGIATLPDAVLVDERSSADFDPDLAIARAAARQWFGNHLTASYWDHAWLNESFPAYYGARFLEHSGNRDRFRLVMHEYLLHYLRETESYVRPLVWNRWNHPADVLDAHAAGKGAWVLHMLRHTVGSEAFDDAVAMYTGGQAERSVSTDHLFEIFASFHGLPMEDFFSQWIYSAGHPQLEISYSFNFSSQTLSLRIDQVQEGPGVPEVFSFEAEIEVSILDEPERFTIDVRRRSQTFELPVSLEPDYVLFDPEGRILADVAIEQSSVAWVRQLHMATDLLSRIRAAEKLSDFADDTALLLGLRNALERERAPAVLSQIARTLGKLPHSESLQTDLFSLYGHEDSEVRKAVIEAIADFRGVPAAASLARQAAEEDVSYLVQAEAVRTLGKLQAENAFNVIRAALITPSHNEVIRSAAFDALRYMDEPAARKLELAGEWTSGERPWQVRLSAITLLESLSPANSRALNQLHELAADPFAGVRLAAVKALGEAGSEASMEILEARYEHDPDGRVRSAALLSLSRLQSRLAEF